MFQNKRSILFEQDFIVEIPLSNLIIRKRRKLRCVYYTTQTKERSSCIIAIFELPAYIDDVLVS